MATDDDLTKEEKEDADPPKSDPPKDEPPKDESKEEEHVATRGDMNRVSEAIENLTNIVTNLTPVPGESKNEDEPPRDETPVKPPWHKRKFFG